MVVKNKTKILYMLIPLCLLLQACERTDLAPYDIGNSKNVIPLTYDRQMSSDTIQSTSNVINNGVSLKQQHNSEHESDIELYNGKSPDAIDHIEIVEKQEEEKSGRWVTVSAEKSKNETVLANNNSVAGKNSDVKQSKPIGNTNKKDLKNANPANIEKQNIKQGSKKKEIVKKDSEYIKPVNGDTILKFGENDKDDLQSDGIIIRASAGTPVKAFCNGTVIYAGSDKLPEYGNMVLIKHRNDIVSMYAHLNKISVKKNAKVRVGDIIGTVGKTGEDIQKPQLYFQIMKGNEPLDPAKYF